MKIDFVVDAYSKSQPLQPSSPERRSNKTEPAGDVTKPANVAKTQAPIQNKKATAPKTQATQKTAATTISKEAENVLNSEEKEMLQQLFPPGLFGAGIRAYRNYSAPVEDMLAKGTRIDIKQ